MANNIFKPQIKNIKENLDELVSSLKLCETWEFKNNIIGYYIYVSIKGKNLKLIINMNEDELLLYRAWIYIHSNMVFITYVDDLGNESTKEVQKGLYNDIFFRILVKMRNL